MLTKQTANETRIEKPHFPGYPLYRPEEDIFRMGKRIDENLQDSYDRLMNNNTKISSRLMVSTVSDHFELVANQRNSANVSESLKNDAQRIIGNRLTAIFRIAK